MPEKLLLLHITSDIHLLSSFNCFIGIMVLIPAGDVSVPGYLY